MCTNFVRFHYVEKHPIKTIEIQVLKYEIQLIISVMKVVL